MCRTSDHHASNRETQQAVHQRAMQAAARPGMGVRLHPEALLGGFFTSDRGVLTRRQRDGIWFAAIDGREWCIGSGYDWTIEEPPTTSIP